MHTGHPLLQCLGAVTDADFFGRAYFCHSAMVPGRLKKRIIAKAPCAARGDGDLPRAASYKRRENPLGIDIDEGADEPCTPSFGGHSLKSVEQLKAIALLIAFDPAIATGVDPGGTVECRNLQARIFAEHRSAERLIDGLYFDHSIF